MSNLEWALLYAGIGWYVFPVHSPIITDAGLTVGCTCEFYRQSEDCQRKHPHLYLRPDQHCPQPGKCPVGKWSEISTTDPETIKRWWSTHPNYNIGIDCGKSDLLAFDADTYKQTADLSDLLSWEDRQTVTSLTGGGGEHLIFDRQGKPYGNATGGLPAGFDIRGAGGYIVAAPSLHKSGRNYQWEDGFSPFDLRPLPIPASLDDILSAAKGNAGGYDAELNSEALVDSVAVVERIFEQAELTHYGRQPYGEGIKWILQSCPFNPPEDPHADDQAAFVIVAPDGKIGAGCHHARCQERIQNAESGWRLLRELTGTAGEPAQPVTVQYQVRAILDGDLTVEQKQMALAELQPEIEKAPADAKSLIASMINPGPDTLTRISQIGFSNLPKDAKRDAVRKMNGLIGEKERALLADMRIFGADEDIAATEIKHYDHAGFAHYLAERYPDRFIHNEAFGWMRYTGTHWTKAGAKESLSLLVEKVLRECAEEAVKKDSRTGWKQAAQATAESGNITGTMSLLSSMVYVPVEDLDRNHDLLNCKNGVVNLRTGKLQPHDPKLLITHCASVDYDPAADRSFWTDWLTGTVGAELAEWLQIAVGYSLTGYTNEECMFYIYGPPRAGKGTFTEALMELLPSPFAKEVDFGTFTAKRDGDSQNFDLASLAPCRVIFASESKSYERLNEAKVKSITGGNLVRCAHKHREHFEYKPLYKIWLSANPAVNADPDDDAVWTRIHIAHFPESKVGREDTTLKFKMKTSPVQMGIMAWAVEGALRWFEIGIKPLQAQIEIKAQQRNDLDNTAEWLAQNCTKGGFTANDDLYSDYSAWCKANGVTAKLQKGLTQSLLRRGYSSDVKKIAGRTKRGISGLALVSSPKNAALEAL